MPRLVTSAASVLVASAVQNVFSSFRFPLQAERTASPVTAIHSSRGICFFCHSVQCSEPSRSIFAPHFGQRSSWQGIPSRWGSRVSHFGQMQNPPAPISCRRYDAFMVIDSPRLRRGKPAGGSLPPFQRLQTGLGVLQFFLEAGDVFAERLPFILHARPLAHPGCSPYGMRPVRREGVMPGSPVRGRKKIKSSSWSLHGRLLLRQDCVLNFNIVGLREIFQAAACRTRIQAMNNLLKPNSQRGLALVTGHEWRDLPPNPIQANQQVRWCAPGSHAARPAGVRVSVAGPLIASAGSGCSTRRALYWSCSQTAGYAAANGHRPPSPADRWIDRGSSWQ